MPIEFNCPSCLKSYRVADAHVGKRTKCKECGNPMTVPDINGLMLADDTREVRRPPKRHSSTKILPENRPRPKPAARKTEEPDPAPKLPGGKLPPPKIPTALKGKPELAKLKKAPGKSRVLEAPKKRRPNVLFILGALAVTTGFFLPWINAGVASFGDAIAGFQLAWLADDLAIALVREGIHGDNALVRTISSKPDHSLVFFALYLIPALALYAAVDDLRCAGKGKGRWYLRLLAALSPALAGAVIYLVLRDSFDAFFAAGGLAGLSIDTDETLKAVGPGAWTFAGGWLLLVLGVVIAPKVKKPKNTNEPAPKAGPSDE